MTKTKLYQKYLALVEKLKALQEQEWKIKLEIYQIKKEMEKAK
jgi:hypothetical protein